MLWWPSCGHHCSVHLSYHHMWPYISDTTGFLLWSCALVFFFQFAWEFHGRSLQGKKKDYYHCRFDHRFCCSSCRAEFDWLVHWLNRGADCVKSSDLVQVSLSPLVTTVAQWSLSLSIFFKKPWNFTKQFIPLPVKLLKGEYTKVLWLSEFLPVDCNVYWKE